MAVNVWEVAGGNTSLAGIYGHGGRGAVVPLSAGVVRPVGIGTITNDPFNIFVGGGLKFPTGIIKRIQFSVSVNFYNYSGLPAGSPLSIALHLWSGTEALAIQERPSAYANINTFVGYITGDPTYGAPLNITFTSTFLLVPVDHDATFLYYFVARPPLIFTGSPIDVRLENISYLVADVW